jgi:hypothetical protein
MPVLASRGIQSLSQNTVRGKFDLPDRDEGFRTFDFPHFVTLPVPSFTRCWRLREFAIHRVEERGIRERDQDEEEDRQSEEV